MKSFAILITLLAFPILADDIQLGTPIYGGTGCPAGSASATLSPNGKNLSVLFDTYLVEVGGTTGKTVNRKSCNLAIPVHVPRGMNLSIFAIRQHGFNNLPEGAFSKINLEYFFAGTKGPVMSKEFKGPLNSDYLLLENFANWSPIWSRCGEEVNIRLNSSILVKTNPSNQQAISMVNQIDSPGGLIYFLQWKKC